MLTKERLLHPATIIATIALLVALSGAGYAATKIGTGQLKNNAVTTAKIKNNAITTAKIRTGAVQGGDLATNAVTARALAPNAVTGRDLAAGAVGTASIANGAVSGDKVATGAITAAKLGNGSVTDEKLGANSVTAAKIAGGTITAANVAPGQFVTGAGALVSGRLALATGAANTLLLTLPGIATVQVACSGADVPTTTVTNASGATLTAASTGVNDATGDFAERNELAPGAAFTLPNAGADGIQGTTWQLSYTGAGNVAHVATVNVALSTAVAPATGCVASAQALSTG
jgi:trimeric autotransporter adhesin